MSGTIKDDMNDTRNGDMKRHAHALEGKRVAVLMGGDSAEREISLNSGRHVLSALQASGVEAVAIDPSEEMLLSGPGLELLVSCDAAFIALHGAGGEDGTVQAILEYLKVPYTGSGVQASSMAMDKRVTKQIWRAEALPTPEFALISSDAALQGSSLDFNQAWIVKPSREGSSIGMSMARSADELAAAYHAACAYDSDVLVERFVEGEEYTVAILNDQPLPAVQLITGRTFYDYEAKYLSGQTEYLIPCGLSQEEEARLQSLCLSAYKAMGCRGWGRVDVMRDAKGQFWLLEVNTVPGMTQRSLVPMAAKAVGLEFDALVMEILSSATLGR